MYWILLMIYIKGILAFVALALAVATFPGWLVCLFGEFTDSPFCEETKNELFILSAIEVVTFIVFLLL